MESPIVPHTVYWQTRVHNSNDNMNGTQPINYNITTITDRDSDRVLDFLRRFFFRDEPLNVCVGLLDGPDDRCQELEQFCLHCIADGVSLMAVSPNGNILGISLNGVITRDKDKQKDKEDECPNPKFRKILRLLTTVYEDSNVFKHFPEVDKVLDIKVASVDDTCRGHGIAKALFDSAKSLAQEQSIPVVRVDCTSYYSAKAVARLGFQCIYTLQYRDYVDSNGVPIFTPELPHTCVKSYVFAVSSRDH